MSNEPGLTEAINNVEPDSYLETLVGDGRKYSDPEALAKALFHAQIHIKTMEEEAADAREQQASMDQILAEVRKSTTSNGEPPMTGENPNGGMPPAQESPSVNPVDVTEMVDRALTDREERAKKKANTDILMRDLSEFYGSETRALKAIKSIIDKASDPQGAARSIDELGFSDPRMAYKFVTGEVPRSDPQPIVPSEAASNTGQALPVGDVGQLTWKKCQEVRKEDPKRYHSPDFRAAMEQAVAGYQAAGKDFFAT